MPDLRDYLEVVGMAGAVSQHTGNHTHGAKAGGYAAWVESVTGELPRMVKLPNNRVQLILSETQVSRMQDFLDNQVSGMLSRKEPPVVDYGIGPAIKPWALKHAIPAGVIILLAGYITGKIF